ncbi:globin [Halomonas campisalis]|uniref:Globin n=1 Tax=Billgrantia campisalis TaxID=74661 RepID=A0ABS9P6J9_9GAMM|nr:globin [Halomonas campisalis]MCG6656872.1 globin [Halomonas campisalis]MDR5862061.1 globin [Halomonas campisalis]
MDIERLFDASYLRVLNRQVDDQDFFSAFYDRFIAASPEVAVKFRHTDMPRQRSMLKKAFYHLLAFYVSSHADYYLHQVAILHSRAHLDIRPALYDLWLDCLVDTARVFDEQFDADIELAWRLVMTPGIVYMTFHYDRGGEEPA